VSSAEVGWQEGIMFFVQMLLLQQHLPRTMELVFVRNA